MSIREIMQEVLEASEAAPKKPKPRVKTRKRKPKVQSTTRATGQLLTTLINR